MASGMTPRQVRAFRVRAQQLDRAPGTAGPADTAVLDLGVQDTGTDGGHWALALRGVDATALDPDALVLFWTLRGAPHFYRRADAAEALAAVAPFSEADAGKRIFDARKPLAAAGIGSLAALDAVAEAMRASVTAPMVKGEVSRRLAETMPEPYLRYCRRCAATHLYEQTFRLGAVRAGLELAPGTSPPVLTPAGGLRPAGHVPPRMDVVRGYLRLLGPATPTHVASFLDAPVADVRARWPADAVEVSVAGERRWLLGDSAASGSVRVTRLLGPHDLFLQAQDRPLLADDAAHAKALWPTVGRPGGVLVDGDVAGVWRPRASSGRLTVRVELWAHDTRRVRAALGEQAELLAAHRGVRLATLDVSGHT